MKRTLEKRSIMKTLFLESSLDFQNLRPGLIQTIQIRYL